MAIVLLFCAALIVLPLWASWQGMGEASISKERDAKTGRILYVGSRGWVGGGPSTGK